MWGYISTRENAIETGAAAGDGPEKPLPAESGHDTRLEPGKCRACGRRANVHVLHGYEQGHPVYRRFCQRCADVQIAVAETTSRSLGLKLSSLVGLAGASLLLIGLLGDYLIPEGHPGFGSYQRLGVLIGAALVGSGLITRAGVVAVAGALFGAASLFADYFGLTRGPGIGYKQQALVITGLAFVSLAVAIRVWRSRRPHLARRRTDAKQARPLHGRRVALGRS